jgi:hypothetical protein
MAYIHIPVDFQNPTEQDFHQFCAVMADLQDVPVHVHCIANYRVSAFFYRYRRDVLGMDDATARADMEDVWHPEGVWAAFIDTKRPTEAAGWRVSIIAAATYLLLVSANIAFRTAKPGAGGATQLCFIRPDSDFPFFTTLGIFDVPGLRQPDGTVPGLHHFQMQFSAISDLFEALAVQDVFDLGLPGFAQPSLPRPARL